MSLKLLINSLTLLCCLSPALLSGSGVKDMINYRLIASTPCSHGADIDVHVSSIELLENLEDGKQIVVLDAGHGGHDPGTSGKNSKEKNIALDITLKLGEFIKKTNPNIEVIYTRTTDVFIPLHKRIGLANRKKADLFVSIHCNYVGNPHVCGTETFVMGLHRAEDNLNVAKRENSSVLLENEYEANYDGYDPNSPVGHILLSMYQNVFLDHSINLANSIENSFGNRKKTKSRGVKQAGFVVLRQATMPSVLVESGFLSNAKEEKYLMSKTGQLEIASSVGNGVVQYINAMSTPSNNTSQATKTDVVNTKKKEKASPKKQVVNNSKKNKTSSYYTIQIGVFSKKRDKSFHQKLTSNGELFVIEVNNVFKYTVGKYSKSADAKTTLDRLKKEGFTDAFVKKVKG